MSITLSQAQELVSAVAVESAATERRVAAVVVDPQGEIILASRPDGCSPMMIKLATAKAYTAAVMERPTIVVASWDHSSPEMIRTLSELSGRTMMMGYGGFTIAKDGVVLGALGISGAPGDIDQMIAERSVGGLGYDLVFDVPE